ncbi:hypothetical protein [Melittangium boletus]|uniref:hypothetical protein n=1 Tax=Melittangium boletus TaxID=83453 RepID=UPI003DA42888
MLHGLSGAVSRNVRSKGGAWAREYLKTGGFTQPQRMLQVLPGEQLQMEAGVVFDVVPAPRWRVHLLSHALMGLNAGVPEEMRQSAEDAFEAFCLGTPWGALFQAVTPYPLRSAERMARRLAALLRFWDVLQGPRYACGVRVPQQTLEELIGSLYRETLDAWCPGGPTAVREHVSRSVERMAHATREECMEVLLRVMPALVGVDPDFEHRERLRDPGFLRERLAALAPEDFADISSGYKFTVVMRLAAWDRQLGRH